MKGLECSEVNYSVILQNKDVRIDSAFCIGIPKKNKTLQYKKIGDCLLKSYYGISINMNENKQGYPIYRMNEIHNMLCDLDVSKYADISLEEFKKFELKDRDVLFNRTNSYEFVGRTGIYYKNDNGDRTFASYLVCFNPDENIVLPEYLTAFLNSKQGVWDIKRRARQSINQTNVNPEEVKQIEIPLLSMDIQNIIKESFEKANCLLTQSQSVYHSAEQVLLKSLGLENWQPKNEATTVKKFSDYEKSGRLDAEYYQPKYEEIENRLQGTGIKIGKVSDYFLPIIKNCELTQDEYKYIEISDINIGDGSAAYNVVNREDLPANAKIFVNQNDILVSKVRPYRGAVSIVDVDEKDLIVSGAFCVLREKSDFLKEVLQVLLRTSIYKEWLLKWNVGSSYPVIKDDDVLNLQIPILDISIQKDIADKVQESFRLRQQSKELLERAKRAVEIAIEQGEEKAMEWLKKKE